MGTEVNNMPITPWSCDNDKKLITLYTTHTDSDLAHLFGRPVTFIRDRRRKLKLFRKSANVSTDEADNIAILYKRDGFSVHKIGEILNRSSATVQFVLKKLGCKRNRLRKDVTNNEILEYVELFVHGGLNPSQIGKLYNRGDTTVRRYLIAQGVPITKRRKNIKIGDRFGDWVVIKRDRNGYDKSQHCTRWICKCTCGTIRSVNRSSLIKGLSTSCGCKRHTLSGENSPSWKGGEFVSKNGYVMINIPGHPFCKEGYYVRRSRFVMGVEKLGRMPNKNETVHHIDGDRSNDTIDNLELRLVGDHPPGQRVIDKFKYGIDIINKYYGTEVVSELTPDLVKMAVSILKTHRPETAI